MVAPATGTRIAVIPTDAASPAASRTATGPAPRCRTDWTRRPSIPAAAAPSSIAASRTTVSPPQATSGPSWRSSTTPPTKDHYDNRRDHGDGHAAALRTLFNRMLGQLHHYLTTGQLYDPIEAV